MKTQKAFCVNEIGCFWDIKHRDEEKVSKLRGRSILYT